MFKKNTVAFYVFLLLLFGTSFRSEAIPTPGGDGDTPVWIIQFYASSSYAKVGKPVYITWKTAYAGGCRLKTNLGSNTVTTNGSQVVYPINTQKMIVTLTCASQGGKQYSRTLSFSVNASDHPELNSFTTSGNTFAGNLITINWSSKYASQCKLTGTNTATLPANGSKSFVAREGNNYFNMQCTSADGRISNPRGANVNGASPYPYIQYFNVSGGGEFYSLTWNAIAESCVLDGFSVGRNGSVSRSAQGIIVRHNLVCFRNGYSTSSTVTYRPPTNGGGGGGPGPILGDEDGNMY